MVKLFFGLPGCGKTTLLVKTAIQAVKRHKYDNVYSNIPINYDGITFIDNSWIGRYQLEDGLILIDEGSLFADSRDYKNFSKDLVSFFMLHRHYNVDIYIYSQGWDAVDKKIRVICDRVYYVYKGLGRNWFTRYYRIPYGIIIPDPKKSDSEKLGEIVQGYCKPPLLMRLFCPFVFRPLYYRYFDSWDCPPLPPLPDLDPFTGNKLSPKTE